MPTKKMTVLTLGTSVHDWAAFQTLLENAGVEAVIDIRSRPYSRFEHFNQPQLRARLNHCGLAYLHLGALGGPVATDKRSYKEVMLTVAAGKAVEDIMSIAARCRPALICAEADPLTCHRLLMVSPVLAAHGVAVIHILKDGKQEAHNQTTARLVKRLRMREDDLWEPWPAIVERAIGVQEKKLRGLK